eukprot:3941345-Rhodomonas_salina.3
MHLQPPRYLSILVPCCPHRRGALLSLILSHPMNLQSPTCPPTCLPTPLLPPSPVPYGLWTYAVFSTDMDYGPMPVQAVSHLISSARGSESCNVLRRSLSPYQLSTPCPVLTYALPTPCPVLTYAPPMPCPVLTYAMAGTG